MLVGHWQARHGHDASLVAGDHLLGSPHGINPVWQDQPRRRLPVALNRGRGLASYQPSTAGSTQGHPVPCKGGPYLMGRRARWWWRSQPSETDWALICPGVVERTVSILPTDSLLWFWLGGRPARGELAGWLAGWPADLVARLDDDGQGARRRSGGIRAHPRTTEHRVCFLFETMTRPGGWRGQAPSQCGWVSRHVKGAEMGGR